MGDTNGVLLEIEKVSETKPNILDAKGIVIATFASVVTPRELSDWFRLNKRSFLVFDLTPESAGFHISKKEIHEGLFGFLKTMNLEDKSAELLREINLTSETKTNEVNLRLTEVTVNSKIKKWRLSEAEIKKMTKIEKDEWWNKIMDNGFENLTEEDKKLLQILSK
jgi:hypothetical protein